jgi:hypothetical protein
MIGDASVKHFSPWTQAINTACFVLIDVGEVMPCQFT